MVLSLFLIFFCNKSVLLDLSEPPRHHQLPSLFASEVMHYACIRSVCICSDFCCLLATSIYCAGAYTCTCTKHIFLCCNHLNVNSPSQLTTNHSGFKRLVLNKSVGELGRIQTHNLLLSGADGIFTNSTTDAN